MKFDFAQVWDRGQGTKDLEEGKQDAAAEDDFWAGVLKRAAEEREKKRAQELTGRGARKRAVTVRNRSTPSTIHHPYICYPCDPYLY